MTALDPSERPRHLGLLRELFEAVQAVEEMPDGYAFGLPDDDDILLKCARFIANERRCCPFFGFELVVAPNGGPPWLRLTGREGIKPFIVAEIGGALEDVVARTADFRESNQGESSLAPESGPCLIKGRSM